ncbi:receptor protein-tyrosine kinase, variant 2 [Balamuthia mandrillaris]
MEGWMSRLEAELRRQAVEIEGLRHKVERLTKDNEKLKRKVKALTRSSSSSLSSSPLASPACSKEDLSPIAVAAAAATSPPSSYSGSSTPTTSGKMSRDKIVQPHHSEEATYPSELHVGAAVDPESGFKESPALRSVKSKARRNNRSISFTSNNGAANAAEASNSGRLRRNTYIPDPDVSPPSSKPIIPTSPSTSRSPPSSKSAIPIPTSPSSSSSPALLEKEKDKKERKKKKTAKKTTKKTAAESHKQKEPESNSNSKKKSFYESTKKLMSSSGAIPTKQNKISKPTSAKKKKKKVAKKEDDLLLPIIPPVPKVQYSMNDVLNDLEGLVSSSEEDEEESNEKSGQPVLPQQRQTIESSSGQLEAEESEEESEEESDDDSEDDYASNSEVDDGPSWTMINFHELRMQALIGSGAFGKVHKGTWRGRVVAIKQLHDKVEKGDSEEFLREAKLMGTMKPHRNLLRFLGVCLSLTDPTCIVTEFMPNGSLLDWVRKHHQQITGQLIIRMALDVARGMRHLHRQRVTHRDLAARNLLLAADMTIKIADFGMSRQRVQGVYVVQKTTTTTGPLKWMAPESLEHLVYSEKTDVWSYGVTLWEITNRGSEPFGNLSNLNAAMGVMHEGLRLTAPTWAPKVIQQIINVCFEYEPEDR